MINGICRQTVENFKKISNGKKIVLWGAVNESVQQAISQYTNIDCIIDSDSERWGMKFESLTIYPPEHLYALSSQKYIVLITAGTRSVYSITRTIKAVDDFDIFYFNAISDKFLCHFSNRLYDNLEKIREVEKALSDDMSRKVYREVVLRRIMGATWEFSNLKVTNSPQYIYTPMFENMGSNEIFIDCGGYTGDSIEKFVLTFGNKVRKIYSFECFQENITKLEGVGVSLHNSDWRGELVVAPYAVSDKNTKLVFNDIGKPEGGYLTETRTTVEFNDKLAPINTIEVEAVKLDDFIPAGEHVTLFKMDIEGAEYAALMGAEKIIKKYKPRLAISIYHNPDDYWRIYELIHEFYPDYKFAVRHHQNNHLDTVLYAWEEE